MLQNLWPFQSSLVFVSTEMSTENTSWFLCVYIKKGRVYRVYRHMKTLILLLFSEYFSEEIFSRFLVHVSDMNQLLRQWMESSRFPWSRLWKRTGRKASIVQQAKYPRLEWIDLLHSDAWAGWTETPLSFCLSPPIILQDYEIVLFIFT